MNTMELRDKWILEEQQAFKGWDFSRLNNRWVSEKLPWSYEEWVSKYLRKNDQLLDMGTGGGEFMLSLGHPYSSTSVTEAWEPNVKICKETLEPLGITVKQVFDDKELPFDDDTLDIIINRHESYDLDEVRRISKGGGLFVTQQVGGKNNEMLSNFLVPDFGPNYPDQILDKELVAFDRRGFDLVYSNEYFPYLRFFDIGAIVYFAHTIEWEFPGFTVDSCFEKLLELEERLQVKGYVESTEHRYIIVAKNNK